MTLFVTPTIPNQTDYTTFLYNVVGIPTANLPSSADIITTSLGIAQAIVSDDLGACNANSNAIPSAPTLYVLAVYNLAADRLINFATDVTGQTYFQDWRKALRINEVSVGVPSSASDGGTATGILNPEQLERLTLLDLSTLKTPFGRTYMGFAQAYGTTIWGLS